MRRITTLTVALVVAVMAVIAPALSRPAAALDTWCWDDPVVEIGGQRVSINIGVRERDLSKVAGAVVVITVPQNVTTRLISVDDVFPVRVRFVQEGKGNNGNIPVTVHNTLIARGSFDYQMNATTNNGRTVLAHEQNLMTNRVATMEFKLKTR
jgi:hypothetical protein